MAWDQSVDLNPERGYLHILSFLSELIALIFFQSSMLAARSTSPPSLSRRRLGVPAFPSTVRPLAPHHVLQPSNVHCHSPPSARQRMTGPWSTRSSKSSVRVDWSLRTPTSTPRTRRASACCSFVNPILTRRPRHSLSGSTGLAALDSRSPSSPRSLPSVARLPVRSLSFVHGPRICLLTADFIFPPIQLRASMISTGLPSPTGQWV